MNEKDLHEYSECQRNGEFILEISNELGQEYYVYTKSDGFAFSQNLIFQKPLKNQWKIYNFRNI